jgi:hypothetical protein
MPASPPSSIWYVYGIVPAKFAPTTLPSGLDDVDVTIERFDGTRVAALVSILDEKRYAPNAVETNSGDVEWLSPRAVAHDRVLTWASDLGAVIPLPMFSLFSGRDAVRAMLDERSAELEETLEKLGTGREYALRVYRIDRELLGVITTLSPRLGELAATAAAASPGQRYLLERKLETEKKAEVRVVTQRVVDEIMSELGAHASLQARSPIPRVSEADAAASNGSMVLNAAFFVTPDAFEAFQKTLTSLIERHGTTGLRFDFTGPWPPYHFAGARVEAAGHGA